MNARYACTKKCFFNNSLYEEGAVGVFDDKDMKGNPCFKRIDEIPKAEVPKKKKDDADRDI